MQLPLGDSNSNLQCHDCDPIHCSKIKKRFQRGCIPVKKIKKRFQGGCIPNLGFFFPPGLAALLHSAPSDSPTFDFILVFPFTVWSGGVADCQAAQGKSTFPGSPVPERIRHRLPEHVAFLWEDRFFHSVFNCISRSVSSTCVMSSGT